MYIYIYIYICVCVCICIYKYICMYICIYIYIQAIPGCEALVLKTQVPSHQPPHDLLSCRDLLSRQTRSLSLHGS